MVRLSDLTEGESDFLSAYDCPTFAIDAFNQGPPLPGRKVAVITTAGLRRKTDRPYAVDAVDYRLLPTDSINDLVMDHVAAGFDRTGFAQDLNIVLPVTPLNELANEGAIDSVADMHYSFMGAGDVAAMKPAAIQVARALKAQHVDSVLLSPV